jgi:phage shock protein PspC (stress-responsive transcriptional regulator)
MTCQRCQHELPAEAAFCPACGAPQHAGDRFTDASRRLTRIPADGKIAGVCAGIADYLGVDVTLVRIVWVTLSIVPGSIIGGIVAYAVAWLVMPEGASTSGPQRRLTRSATDAKVAGVCGGLAEYFGVDATPIRVLWVVASLVPPVLAGGIVAYVAAWLILPKGPVALLKPSQSQAA